jgi:hypothetical protein
VNTILCKSDKEGVESAAGKMRQDIRGEIKWLAYP